MRSSSDRPLRGQFLEFRLADSEQAAIDLAIVLSEFGGAARRSDGSLAELCERARQPQRAPSRLAIIYVHEIFARLKLLVASDVGDRRDWTEQHPALEGLLIDFSLGHGHEERLDR